MAASPACRIWIVRRMFANQIDPYSKCSITCIHYYIDFESWWNVKLFKIFKLFVFVYFCVLYKYVLWLHFNMAASPACRIWIVRRMFANQIDPYKQIQREFLIAGNGEHIIRILFCIEGYISNWNTGIITIDLSFVKWYYYLYIQITLKHSWQTIDC
jgi:hypothetical protein